MAHLPWYSGIGAAAGAVAGSWAFARFLYGIIIRRMNGRAEKVMSTLEQRVREAVSKP